MPEEKRGCGYRVLGGLYLCSDGIAVACDRLPYLLELCRVCGQGIEQGRGFTKLDWAALAGDHEAEVSIPASLDETVCKDNFKCPLCQPVRGEIMYLMWVGRKFYTPEEFSAEAARMGVSKRIAFIPDGLVLGETRVLLAHPDACSVTRLVWRCSECGDYFEAPEPIDEGDLSRWKDSAVDSVQVFSAASQGAEPSILYDPAWYRTTSNLSRHAEKHRKKDETFIMIEEEGTVIKPGIFYSFVPTRVELLITEEQSKDETFMAGLKKRGITPVPVKRVFQLKCGKCSWEGNSNECGEGDERTWRCPNCGERELTPVRDKRGKTTASLERI
jgi:rubrerythrin